MEQLEKWFALYFGEKAPRLPEGVKKVIVAIAPWLTLVAVVLTLPIILFALGLGALLTPLTFLGGVAVGTTSLLSLLFSGAMFILYILALPGLFKRSRGGWRFVYYAVLLGGVESLVNFSFFGLIIGAGLSLYVLFQVRSLYH